MDQISTYFKPLSKRRDQSIGGVLKGLLKSKNDDLIKQAIQLILSLEEPQKIYEAFKEFVEDADVLQVKPGPKLIALFQDALERYDDDWDEYWNTLRDTQLEPINRELAQCCLLSLIKIINGDQCLTSRLSLTANPYFEEFDLINTHFPGINQLELMEFKWDHVQSILRANPQVHELSLNGRSLSEWDGKFEGFKQIKKLSLTWVNVHDLFGNTEYSKLLPLLEAGMIGKSVYRNNDIKRILEEESIHLKSDKKRWVSILKRMGLSGRREVKGVFFNITYCPKGIAQSKYKRVRFKASDLFVCSQTMVSQALWEAVMEKEISHFRGPTLPVDSVSWFDAVRFCNALSLLEDRTPAYSISDKGKKEPFVVLDKDANGYRLPLACEWEYVALAKTQKRYSGSDELDEVGWYTQNSDRKTHPLASKKSNAWGLYDLSGNAQEWCNDSYQVYDDLYVYQSKPSNRSIRGGSWKDSSQDCQIIGHFSPTQRPSTKSQEISFRLFRKLCQNS